MIFLDVDSYDSYMICSTIQVIVVRCDDLLYIIDLNEDLVASAILFSDSIMESLVNHAVGYAVPIIPCI